MIRRHLEALRLALVIADGGSAALLFMTIALVRYGSGEWAALWLGLGLDLWVTAAVYGVVWVAALGFHGLYKLRMRWRFRNELLDIVRSGLIVTGATLSFLYITDRDTVSRVFLAILLVSQPVLTITSRIGLRALFAWYRSQGRNQVHMLVVGANPMAEGFANRLEAHRTLGIVVVGHLVGPSDGAYEPSRPLLGTADDVLQVLHRRIIDEVAVCLPIEEAELTERITVACAEEGKVVRIPHPTPEPGPAESRLEELDGLTVETVFAATHRTIGLFAKRMLDVVLAAIGLVALSPLLVGVAVAVAIADGRPIMFRQVRVGRHGRPFTIYKLRTMTRDAEQRLDEVLHLNQRDGAAFKMDDDPRVTRLGRFLRRTSLDELPQLWNVLLGQMSLVGPRPPLPGEVDRYDSWHRRRLSMKPGITGLWQIHARGEPVFDRWVELDLRYIDHWSLWLDLAILARTVPAMLKREGR